MSNPFFSLLVSVLSGSTRRKVKYWRIDAIVSYLFPITDVEEVTVSVALNEVIISLVVIDRYLDDVLGVSCAFNGIEIRTPVVVVGSPALPESNYIIDKDIANVNVAFNGLQINIPVKSPDWNEVDVTNVSVAFNSLIINLPVRTGTIDTDTTNVSVAFNSMEIIK